MSRANCVKEFSEIPKEKLELLYNHRFTAEKDVPFDEYIESYGTIEADGIFYYRENEKRKVADWVRGTSFGLNISDAVIIGDSIVKNRLGLK
jgi:hypothetical protein